MNDSEQMMTRYLLGELSESERADLERRYFADNAFFERLSQCESDLMDDYARGRLSPETRERFEKAYLADPERRARLRFSEALVAKLDREVSPGLIPQEAETTSWWQKLFVPFIGGQGALAFSFAVLLLMVLGSEQAAGLPPVARREPLQVVALEAARPDDAQARGTHARPQDELAQTRATEAAREQHERELQQQLIDEQARNQQLIAELDRERAQPTPEVGIASPKNTAPAFVSLLLVASGVRGAETKSPTLSIPAGTQEVRIELKTAENEYQSYQLELHALGGKAIFDRKKVKPTITKSGANFGFSVPASRFTSGDYILTLKGVIPSGEVEDVSKSLFRVSQNRLR